MANRNLIRLLVDQELGVADILDPHPPHLLAPQAGCRSSGPRREADALDRIAKLLAEAKPDFPMLVRLKARQQTLKDLN